MTDDAQTAGWDAISAQMTRLYGTQEPAHFGTVIKHMLGGPDPIDGFSWYRAGPPDHWHMVTYGFSELYTKDSDDASTSGFGFELTFRLARQPGDAQPPTWPMNLVQNLARYVFSSGNVFAPGHHMPLNSPIALSEKTELVALFFAEDPELPTIDTPHGRLRFVQMVAATQDELEAVQGWNSDGMLRLMHAKNPRWITELSRGSYLKDAEFRARVDEGKRVDGSSCGGFFVEVLSVKASGLFRKTLKLRMARWACARC